MFDLMYDQNAPVSGWNYNNVEQGMNNPADINQLERFSGQLPGGGQLVGATQQSDGTFLLTRQSPGHDASYSDSASFRVDPSGQVVQVSPWATQKADSPGSTIAQGVALAALAAGGLGAAGFLGGGAAGLGGAGALGGDGAFLGEGAMAGVPAWDAAYSSALLPSAPFGAAGALGASGGVGADVGQYIGSSMLSGPEIGNGAFLGEDALSGVPGWDAAYAGGSSAGIPWESGFPASSVVPGGADTGGLGSWLSGANSFLKSNGSLLNLGGNLLNGFLGSRAAGKVADAQVRASQEANALLKSMYDQTRADNMPALKARDVGLGGYQNLLADPSKITGDPGYQFGLSQGQTALDRSAASRGNLYSGAQIKASQKFGQDYGNTKFDQALDRYGRLAGLGSSGAALVSNAGQNYGNNVSQNMLGIGNANASAYVGGANSWNNALSGAINGWQQQQLLDQLTRRQPGVGGGP